MKPAKSWYEVLPTKSKTLLGGNFVGACAKLISRAFTDESAKTITQQALLKNSDRLPIL